MVLDAEKRHGIPKEIQMDQNEAAMLFLELAYLRKEARDGNLKDRKGIIQILDFAHHTDDLKLRQLTRSFGEVPKDDLQHLITSWHQKKFTVSYKHNGHKIPLIIIPVKVKKSLAESQKAWKEKG